MKHFFRALKVDLRRSVLSSTFLITVLLLLAMQFMSVFADVAQMSSFKNWLYYLNVANTRGSSDMVLLIGCICYAWSYCRDRDCGFYDQVVPRVGFRAFALSRLVSTALSAFLAGVLSICFFTLFLLSQGHTGEPFGDFEGQPIYLGLVSAGRTDLFFLFRCVHTGLMCGMAATSGLAVSAFVRNTHVAIFIPYLFLYAISRLGDLIESTWLAPFKLLFGQLFRNDIQNFLFVSFVMLDVIAVAGYVFYRRAERR